MIRFASNTVPFAYQNLPVKAGDTLSAVQLATLVRWNADAREVAVVCSDRPTLIAIAKAFRAALATGAPARTEPTTEAPAPGARFARRPVVALSPDEAQDLADTTDALVMARGAQVSLQARLEEARDEIARLTGDVAALQARYDEQEQELLALRAAQPKPRARRSRAKAQPKECISDDGLSTY